MLNHKCTLMNAYIPIEYQHVDSGICIPFRRKLHTFCMINEKHPMTMRYYKSSNMRRLEQIRHLSNHPFVIHPFSIFALYWEFMYIIVFSTSILLITTTLMDQSGAALRRCVFLKRFLDMIIFVDVLKNFITGYYDETRYGTIMKPRVLAKHYLRTYFILDLLPTLTSFLQGIRLFVDNKLLAVITHLSVLFNVFRIARLRRCCRTLKLGGQYFNFSNNGIEIFKVIYEYNIIIIWLYGVVYHTDKILEVYIIVRPSRITITTILPSFLAYTRLLLHINDGLNIANHPLDVMHSIVFIGVSYGLTLFLFCNILQMFRKFTQARNQNETLHNNFKAYTEYKGLPIGLRKKIMEFFSFKYQNVFFNEAHINDILSETLREEVQVHISKEHVRKVDILRNLPNDVLKKLVTRLKSQIYLSNDVVVVAGVLGNCMYFIHYGTVAVFTPSGKEMCHLKDGDHFGEIALIFQEPRTASVVAVTPCELLILKRSDFLDVMNTHPESKRKLISMASKRLKMSRSGDLHKLGNINE